MGDLEQCPEPAEMWFFMCGPASLFFSSSAFASPPSSSHYDYHSPSSRRVNLTHLVYKLDKPQSRGPTMTDKDLGRKPAQTGASVLGVALRFFPGARLRHRSNRRADTSKERKGD